MENSSVHLLSKSRYKKILTWVKTRKSPSANCLLVSGATAHLPNYILPSHRPSQGCCIYPKTRKSFVLKLPLPFLHIIFTRMISLKLNILPGVDTLCTQRNGKEVVFSKPFSFLSSLLSLKNNNNSNKNLPKLLELACSTTTQLDFSNPFSVMDSSYTVSEVPEKFFIYTCLGQTHRIYHLRPTSTLKETDSFPNAPTLKFNQEVKWPIGLTPAQPFSPPCALFVASAHPLCTLLIPYKTQQQESLFAILI